ncbi:30S ribosomal protein S20 [Iodidimonas sp. SYSU 1G8]|uniref:30S ribosomal protein S20 n=1 Tax=Iodidimonas sp. SYSU 1G8 TaxID=3133967 RepID=UPI0031FEE7A0
MANSPQARKRIRQTERRTEVNRARRGRIRTFIKKVENALEAGKLDEAAVFLKEAEPEIMRGVSKGVIAKNTASRKISRLNQRLRTLKA